MTAQRQEEVYVRFNGLQNTPLREAAAQGLHPLLRLLYYLSLLWKQKEAKLKRTRNTT